MIGIDELKHATSLFLFEVFTFCTHEGWGWGAGVVNNENKIGVAGEFTSLEIKFHFINLMALSISPMTMHTPSNLFFTIILCYSFCIHFYLSFHIFPYMFYSEMFTGHTETFIFDVLKSEWSVVIASLPSSITTNKGFNLVLVQHKDKDFLLACDEFHDDNIEIRKDSVLRSLKP